LTLSYVAYAAASTALPLPATKASERKLRSPREAYGVETTAISREQKRELRFCAGGTPPCWRPEMNVSENAGRCRCLSTLGPTSLGFM